MSKRRFLGIVSMVLVVAAFSWGVCQAGPQQPNGANLKGHKRPTPAERKAAAERFKATRAAFQGETDVYVTQSAGINGPVEPVIKHHRRKPGLLRIVSDHHRPVFILRPYPRGRVGAFQSKERGRCDDHGNK